MKVSKSGMSSDDIVLSGNNTAYTGGLVYNPYNSASLFFPFTGERGGSSGGGTRNLGVRAIYYTRTAYQPGNLAWEIAFDKTASFLFINSSNQSWGFPIRCVRI